MKNARRQLNSFSESEKRKSHILNLVLLAQADGKWHENEKKFIADVSKRIGLTEEEHADIIFHPETVAFVVAETEPERVTMLYDMLFMMKMDGEVSSEEERICMEIGFRLGFNPMMVQEMIEVMKTYEYKQVPDDSLINILKKYFN